MKNSVWFTWLLGVVGFTTAGWGAVMLIVNRRAPDPINPAALAVITLAGSLLLYLAYTNPASRGRP